MEEIRSWEELRKYHRKLLEQLHEAGKVIDKYKHKYKPAKPLGIEPPKRAPLSEEAEFREARRKEGRIMSKIHKLGPLYEKFRRQRPKKV